MARGLQRINKNGREEGATRSSRGTVSCIEKWPEAYRGSTRTEDKKERHTVPKEDGLVD